MGEIKVVCWEWKHFEEKKNHNSICCSRMYDFLWLYAGAPVSEKFEFEQIKTIPQATFYCTILCNVDSDTVDLILIGTFHKKHCELFGIQTRSDQQKYSRVSFDQEFYKDTLRKRIKLAAKSVFTCRRLLIFRGTWKYICAFLFFASSGDKIQKSYVFWTIWNFLTEHFLLDSTRKWWDPCSTMPLFGNKFSPKKGVPRKSPSLSNLNLDASERQVEFGLDYGPIKLKLGSNEMIFDNGMWIPGEEQFKLGALVIGLPVLPFHAQGGQSVKNLVNF